MKKTVVQPWIKKGLCAGIFLLLFAAVNGQNIKDDDIDFTYIQLPLTPLDKNIKNYQSSIDAVYEHKNNAAMMEYEKEKKRAEDDYNREMAAYPQLVREADDQYEKEMADYKKKSFGSKLGEKVLLGQDNKPVKRVPSRPYLRGVERPVLKSSYDYTTMASTYLHLDGFQNNAAEAVNIIVSLYGFDHTQPRVLSAQKQMTRYANGKSSDYTATYYHVEYTYRHPMAVKVVTPDGKEILNVTPSELNNYREYKSSETDTYPEVNNEVMVKSSEEQILQENLAFINKMINDRFGYNRIKKKARLFYVKSKKGDYDDLMEAYNEASSGLKVLVDDEPVARQKLMKAQDLWKKALGESEPTNKKARVNLDVTTAICFNLLESSHALHLVGEGQEVISRMNKLDLSSREKKRKDEFEMQFNELKKRIQNNQ